MDEELRGDVRLLSHEQSRLGEVTIFHFALPSPMTEIFAGLRGVRILQYHNITPAHFFAPVRREPVSPCRARPPRTGDAGRPRGSCTGRLRVQSAGTAGSGFPADRRSPDRGEHRADHACAAAPRARDNTLGRTDQLPLRRSNRSQQADRGSHPAGRGVQAQRRQLLSLHLCRTLRRTAPLLCPGACADRSLPDAGGALLVHRSGYRTRISPRSTAGRTSTSR